MHSITTSTPYLRNSPSISGITFSRAGCSGTNAPGTFAYSAARPDSKTTRLSAPNCGWRKTQATPRQSSAPRSRSETAASARTMGYTAKRTSVRTGDARRASTTASQREISRASRYVGTPSRTVRSAVLCARARCGAAVRSASGLSTVEHRCQLRSLGWHNALLLTVCDRSRYAWTSEL